MTSAVAAFGPLALGAYSHKQTIIYGFQKEFARKRAVAPH
jgi:hypothetical protein